MLKNKVGRWAFKMCCGPLMVCVPQFENHWCITVYYLCLRKCCGTITLITEQELLIVDLQQASGQMMTTWIECNIWTWHPLSLSVSQVPLLAQQHATAMGGPPGFPAGMLSPGGAPPYLSSRFDPSKLQEGNDDPLCSTHTHTRARARARAHTHREFIPCSVVGSIYDWYW